MGKATDTDLRAEEVDRLVADVLECAGALRRYGDALTRPLGQTEVRWAVLSVLSGGARTVPQVARRLGVTRQSVQRVANLLAAEGLIESAPNPDNARSPLFRLSKRGEEVLTATCDLAKVDASRTHWPFFRDRRIDAYGDLTKRYLD